MKKSNFINGHWVEGLGLIKNINPSDTSDIIDEYTSCTADQFEIAVQSATAAQKEWQQVGIEKRSQILSKIGDEIISRSEELGELLSREEGKPISEGIGEVNRAGQYFQYFQVIFSFTRKYQYYSKNLDGILFRLDQCNNLEGAYYQNSYRMLFFHVGPCDY